MAKVRSSAGSQVVRKVARESTKLKPRIIYAHSPKVYKIEPEEFLDLVQKLTGRSDSDAIEVDVSTTSTSGFSSHDITSTSSFITSEVDSAPVATPLSTQLLDSLPSPRFVTLNFLPMLAATPSHFNQSQRDARFSLFSAAF